MRAAPIVLVVAIACRSAFAAGQPSPTREAVPVERLRDGTSAFSTYSGLSDSVRLVVRDTGVWRQVWETIHKPFFPRPPLPLVDFQRQAIVVAAMGNRPTGGYDVLVEGAVEDSTGIEIGVRVAIPGSGCVLPAVVTQPVDLARIPASRRTIRFRQRNVVVPCGVR